MNWITHHLGAHLTALQAGDLVKLGVLLSADVLIVFSIASVAVVIERALALSRARRIEENEYAALRDLWRRESNEMVRSRVAVSPAPSAQAVCAGLELQSDLQNPQSNARTHSAKPETVRELVREAIGQGLENENAKLARNLPILATVASTAPYIGLFGTVLGILSAFARIAQTNQTGASVVAAPIAEALTATGLGLGVAIPAVMAYNYFSGRVGDLMLRVETHALDLSARLLGVEATSSSGTHAPQSTLTPAPELVQAVATGVTATSVEANHAR